MIVEPLASSEAFPPQGRFLGLRVLVRFGYAPPDWRGVIVRDDTEAPGLLIIRLDDGRHVLSTECQYSPISAGEGEPPITIGIDLATGPDLTTIGLHCRCGANHAWPVERLAGLTAYRCRCGVDMMPAIERMRGKAP